jgi:hypothetical protein
MSRAPRWPSFRQPAAGCTDLLAEVARLAEGFAEGTIEYPRAKTATDLR